MNVTTDELVAELQTIAPETFERAMLRVVNRKQAERIAELEGPNPTPPPKESEQ